MSRISVTVGQATVDIEQPPGGFVFGQPASATAYNPHDLAHAAIKAMRAIDSDESRRYADRFADVWAEIVTADPAPRR